MKKKLFWLFVLQSFNTIQIQGQSVDNAQLPIPINLQTAYTKGTRSTDGQVGTHYWQNRADYDIHINFEPKTRLIQGSEDIVYINNSPDTLNRIVFKLYPNFYKKGSPRNRRIEDEDAGEGVAIQKLSVNDEVLEVKNIKIDGTNMVVRIQPLAPKQSMRLNIIFSYILNKGSHNRTGQIDEGSYFIAYFFPRIAVYDDIDGWNLNPYLGAQEFYNDFCDFKTRITLPKDYVVWATGDLKNCREVLSSKYCEKLDFAEKNDGITTIIDSFDIKTGGIFADNATNTWIFETSNVTDVAVGMSNHYMWLSSSLVVDTATGRRTRVDAVFNPTHKAGFPVVADARKTVEVMSFQFPKWAYPYNHETIFEGVYDGMEYPMMVNERFSEDRAECIETTEHEVFHTMFPFYMGINETKYGWMDEGWGTLSEWLISPMIDSTIVDDFAIQAYEWTAGAESDLPIMTLGTQLSGLPFFTNSYGKPALGYWYVKDMLGDDLFLKALHHYIKTWNGKHPMPYDFFNCMNVGSGKNLNWFWKRWFFDNGVPDMAITQFSAKGSEKQILIEDKGLKPVPIDLTIAYTDGSTEKLHRTIEVWEKGNKTVVINFKTDKIVKRIMLGSTYTADTNKKDNEWEVKN